MKITIQLNLALETLGVFKYSIFYNIAFVAALFIYFFIFLFTVYLYLMSLRSVLRRFFYDRRVYLTLTLTAWNFKAK